MNYVENDFKCENCGSKENLLKVIILSPCREHCHVEIYCKNHLSRVIEEFPEDIDLIEKV